MGYYTDAVNNLTGAGNALGSAISTAAIAGTHLKQQAQANEMAILKEGNETSKELNKAIGEEMKLTNDEDFLKFQEESLKDKTEPAIKAVEAAIESGNINDIMASKKALSNLQDKWDALHYNKKNIENRKIDVSQQLENAQLRNNVFTGNKNNIKIYMKAVDKILKESK